MASKEALRLPWVGKESWVWCWTVTNPLGVYPALWLQNDEHLLPELRWGSYVALMAGIGGALTEVGTVLVLASGAAPLRPHERWPSSVGLTPSPTRLV